MTSRQRQILTFVHDALVQTGMAPTVADLCAATSTTHGAVVRHLQALERNGFLRRERGRWRSMVVLNLPGRGLLAGEIAWCHANPERVRALMSITGAAVAA